MHIHHKAALLKARRDFRKARNCMLKHKDTYEFFRAAAVGAPGVEASVSHSWKLKHHLTVYTTAIGEYIAAGEVLVIVERVLENA